MSSLFAVPFVPQHFLGEMQTPTCAVNVLKSPRKNTVLAFCITCLPLLSSQACYNKEKRLAFASGQTISWDIPGTPVPGVLLL